MNEKIKIRRADWKRLPVEVRAIIKGEAHVLTYRKGASFYAPVEFVGGF